MAEPSFVAIAMINNCYMLKNHVESLNYLFNCDLMYDSCTANELNLISHVARRILCVSQLD